MSKDPNQRRNKMKKLALAAAVALSPNFADAQQCIPESEVKEKWGNISTDRVFLGLSNKGVILEIYENLENNNWSVWFRRAATPDMLCALDSGTSAISKHEPYTSPARLSP